MKRLLSILLLVCALVLTPNALSVKAEAVNNANSENATTITPFSFVLQECRATINGENYKRRWNTTYAKWYDAYWVKLSQPFPGP